MAGQHDPIIIWWANNIPIIEDWIPHDHTHPSPACTYNNVGNGNIMVANNWAYALGGGGLFIPNNSEGWEHLKSWGESLKYDTPTWKSENPGNPPFPSTYSVFMDPIRYILGQYWVNTLESSQGSDYIRYMSSQTNMWADHWSTWGGYEGNHLADALFLPQKEIFGVPQHLHYKTVQLCQGGAVGSTCSELVALNLFSGYQSEDPRPYIVHRVRLTVFNANRTADENAEVLQTIQNRIVRDNTNPISKYKEDHVFLFPMPYSNKEYLDAPQTNALVYDVKPEYNFYNKEYEDEISVAWQHSYLFPHLELITYEMMGKDNDPKFSMKAVPEYMKSWKVQTDELKDQRRNFITLYDEIKAFEDILLSAEDAAKAPGLKAGTKIGEQDTENYFTAWTNAVKRLKNKGTFSIFQNKLGMYKNQILFPKKGEFWAWLYQRQKEFFPMQMHLNFTPIPPPSWVEPLEGYGGDVNSLLQLLLEAPPLWGDSWKVGAMPLWYAFLKLFMDGEDSYMVPTSVIPTKSGPTGTIASVKAGLGKKNLKEYDFYTFMEKLDPDSIGYSYAISDKTKGYWYLKDNNSVPSALIVSNSEDPNLFAATSIEYEDLNNTVPPAATVQALQASMETIKKKFAQLVEKKTRSYPEILSGKMACTEVLFWRVSKWDSQSTAPLQSFYYINKPDINEIKLVDTQVGYGRKITYKLHAITAVFGSDYEYQPIEREVKTNLHVYITPEEYARYKDTVLDPNHINTTYHPDGKWNMPAGYSVQPSVLIHWPDHQKFVDPHLGYPLWEGFTSAWDPFPWAKPFFESGGLDVSEVEFPFLSHDSWSVTNDFIRFLQTYTNAIQESNIIPSPFSNAMAGDRYHYFGPSTPGQKVTVLSGVRQEVTGWGPTANSEAHLEFNVISRPSVKIIEVPYGEINTVMVDSPPLPPIVRLTPYMGINDRFLFSFDAGTGKVEATPIALLPEDEQAIEKQLIAQGVDTVPPILTYEADDPPAYYEIFRINPPETESEILVNQTFQYYPPVSYDSFKNNSVYKKVLTNGAPSTTFLENVRPNKKYYYTFRAKDIHENISNPSSMYEIQLVDDGGAVYLLVEVYRPEMPARTNMKSVRRYFSVIPTLEQTMINKAPGSGNKAGNYSLSLAEESIFDDRKIFKVRLISKQTGKKIDFNINFNNTQHK